MKALRNWWHQFWANHHERARIDIWREVATPDEYDEAAEIANYHRIERDYHQSKIKP